MNAAPGAVPSASTLWRQMTSLGANDVIGVLQDREIQGRERSCQACEAGMIRNILALWALGKIYGRRSVSFPRKLCRHAITDLNSFILFYSAFHVIDIFCPTISIQASGTSFYFLKLIDAIRSLKRGFYALIHTPYC